MPDLSLVFDLIARDNASSEVHKVGDAFEDSGGHASRFGGLATAGLLGAVAAVPAAAAALYAMGSTFDDVGDSIRVTTGKSGEQLDALVESAKTVGKTVPASFDEIGNTIGQVNQRLGLTGPTLETLTSQIVQAGKIMGTEVDVNSLSSAFSAFNVTGDATTGTMDQLYRISQSTGVGINTLTAQVATGAPQLKGFGFTIGESAALLGSLDKAGLNSDATIAALNKGMVAFAKAGKDPKKALDDTITGIEGFIKKGDQAGALNLAAKIFGTKGANQFVAAVQSGAINVDTLTKATEGNGDTILKAGSDTADFAEKWQLFKNNALLAVEPVADRVFGAMSDAGEKILPQVAGVLSGVGDVVGGVVVPALSWLADVAFNDVFPGVSAVFGFLSDHLTTVEIVAGIIGAVMVPALIAWAAQSVISGVISAATWVAEAVKSSWAAVQQGYSIAAMVAGWVWHGIVAVAQGAIIAGVWVAQIVGGAASAVGSFLLSVGQIVAGWVLQGATAVAQGVIIAGVWTAQVVASAVRGAISLGITVLEVVGGWILMAGTAMIQAAIMAAAWFIALGPIGWVIAAVIGLVALIIANWDTVVGWTKAAFAWVVGAIQNALAWAQSIVGTFVGWITGAWSALVGAVRTAMSWFGDTVRKGIGVVVDVITGLPGRIIDTLAGAGQWLVGIGKDMINGLINGAKSLLSNIGKFFLDIVPGWIRGPFESALGISSPSRVFAAYGGNIGQGLINGLSAMRPAIASELAALADTQGLDSLTATLAGSGGLGYTAPTYGGGAAGGGAAGGNVYHTTVSGVASPEQVAAEVQRAQRTNEFLAGAGS